MQSIVFINPLKPGKLEAYKKFAEENLGPRKKEYIDLLERYGLKTAKVYYHKLNGIEFIIVFHEAEDDALERLKGFPTSKNPYDRWFFEQLTDMHDFSQTETQAECLFTFKAY